jgi:hypothetical protein
VSYPGFIRDVDPDAEAARLAAERKRPAEVTHRCPAKGEFLMPCCGLTPYEVPRTDRMTLAAELVTCTGEKRHAK